MSDEDDFMPSCDSADYDFGYSDNASDQAMDDNPDDDPENLYYQSKSYRESEPLKAKQLFEQIIKDNKGTEIGVKASKQTLKLVVRWDQSSCGSSSEWGSVDAAFNGFLENIVSSQINQSYRDQSFMNMVQVIKDTPQFNDLLRGATSRFASTRGCERLASRITIKLADSLYHEGKFEESLALLNEMDTGVVDSDPWKSTLGLESLALRIQIAMKQGSNQEEQLYDTICRSSEFQMAHPRILAVIRECGGVVAARRTRWAEARTMLLKAFKSYDEAGLPDRVRVLQYHIVCTILTELGINPFDSQEILAYRDSPELGFLQKLVQAFIDGDLAAFKAAIENSTAVSSPQQAAFYSDALVARHMVPALHECFQRQLLLKLVMPYSRVTFEFIACKLEVEETQVPQIMTRQILAGKLPHARIDDANCIVELTHRPFSALNNGKSRLELPPRYQEFATNTEQDAFEKSIISAKEGQKKEDPDLSRVFSDLLDAIDILHTSLRAEKVY